MHYSLFLAAILTASSLLEATPIPSSEAQHEDQPAKRSSLEVINLGLRPATDIVLKRRSNVWKYVNPNPPRLTGSRVRSVQKRGTSHQNNHIECRSRHDSSTTVSVKSGGLLDRARKEFCHAFEGTVVPQGHEFSVQVNGLTNVAGDASHLVGKYEIILHNSMRV